jgi:RimJ/RimL family protein N-acetyltransferase
MSFSITTERLLLREMTPDDAEHAYRLNLDPEVRRYNGAIPFTSVEAARQFLADYPDYRKHGYGRWAMVDREMDTWLGWCGLKMLDDGDVDLGYCLFPEHWGMGYATEAASACVSWGFEHLSLERIIGRVHRENSASIRVLEKVGLRFWKTGPCEHDPEALYYIIWRGGK